MKLDDELHNNEVVAGAYGLVTTVAALLNIKSRDEVSWWIFDGGPENVLFSGSGSAHEHVIHLLQELESGKRIKPDDTFELAFSSIDPRDATVGVGQKGTGIPRDLGLEGALASGDPQKPLPSIKEPSGPQK